MFDIGWGELLVIGIVALIVIGPKELPGVLRTLGQGMSKIRRMASEFQGQFNEAMREAEMADIKKSVDELSAAARGYTHYDPLNPDGLEPAKEEAPGSQTLAEAATPDLPAEPPPQTPEDAPGSQTLSEAAAPKTDEGRAS
jgi:sec-independent protein translocase protein TatB